MKKKNFNRDGMYIPSSEKNWYYFIGLEKKRNATTHTRRNGNFSWKCSRLVIILNRDHFISLHLSLATLSRLFLKQSCSISNYDETQTICGFVWAICRKWFLVVGGSRGKIFLKTMVAKTNKRMSEGKKVHNGNNVLKMLNAYAVFLLKRKRRSSMIWSGFLNYPLLDLSEARCDWNMRTVRVYYWNAQPLRTKNDVI